jgi:hypothetical protein
LVGFSQSAITLISTILGILTAASPFILTTIYNEIVEYPDLFIDVIPSMDNNKTEIKITNVGFEPIKDLLLTVKTSQSIKNIENIFSTTNITLVNPYDNKPTPLKLNESVNYNFSIFEIKIPNLTEGKGDIVTLQTDIVGKPNYDCYIHEFFAIYKDGSKIFKSSCDDPIVKNLKSFVNILGKNALTIILILIIGTFLFFYSYRPYIKKLIQRSVISNIRKDILEARSLIIDNIAFNEELPCREEWLKNNEDYSKLKVKNMGFYKKRIRPDIFDKRDFLDVEDYILIDDYYKKVEERIKLKKFLNVSDINSLLLKYIEKVLENVNWNKYMPHRPLFTTVKEETTDD